MFQHTLDTMELLHLDEGIIEVVDNIGTQISYVKLGRGYCFLSENIIQGSKELNSIPLPGERGIDIIAVWSEKNEVVTKLNGKLSCLTSRIKVSLFTCVLHKDMRE